MKALALALILSTTSISTAIFGDFNNDGNITIADAIQFILIISGKATNPDIGKEYTTSEPSQEQATIIVRNLYTNRTITAIKTSPCGFYTWTDVPMTSLTAPADFPFTIEPGCYNINFSYSYQLSGRNYSGNATWENASVTANETKILSYQP